MCMGHEGESQQQQHQQDPTSGRVRDDFKLTKHEKLSKLEKLSCFPQVKNMLEQGISIKDVALFIQEDAKEYLDASRGSVQSALYRYVESKSDSFIREQVPLPHLGLQQKNIPDMDAINVCNLGLAIQLDRIYIDYTTEKKIKKTINSNTHSLRVLNDLLKTKSLLEQRELEKSRELVKAGSLANSGINLDDIPRLKANYAAKFGDAIANIVFDPGSRRRIINALEKVKRGSNADFIEAMKKKRRSLGLPEEDPTDNIVYVYPPASSQGQ